MVTLKRNRTRIITLAILAFLFFTAIQGMETDDWVITILRGLSVGAVTFLVASGLSLILGLMDVLNLAHGEMFMVGAYVGWTVYVRPDTFIDVLGPLLVIAVPFLLLPVWKVQVGRLKLSPRVAQIWPWIGLVIGLAVLATAVTRFPVSIWDAEVYAESPQTYALALDQGTIVLPEQPPYDGSAVVVVLGTLLGGMLTTISAVGLQFRKGTMVANPHINRNTLLGATAVLVLGLLTLFLNQTLTDWLFNMSATGRFAVAMLVATLTGGVIGALIEMTMIRPLYDRPIYQIMITLGLSFISIEAVRAIWGRPEFTMPKPDVFAGTGAGCSKEVTDLMERLTNQCSTIFFFDGRVRTYNEIFIILVGVVVLIGIWLLLQRTRIGMIIRAGVQDSEMVEALGINVRRVFTFVFALGVALAALGGILAAPSIGLSTSMGASLLLLALIALAIGGLTSFPGAAVGSILVGLLQQFIIKYGSIGINLPFLAEPFKPSPPLVPASTILLMVIILLLLPNGLFGKNE